MQSLVRSGYVPPLGPIEDLTRTFKGAALGQVLDSQALTEILHLLITAKHVVRFIHDFRDRCPPLDRFGRLIYPLPKLSGMIERSIGPDGEVLDSASPELSSLRKAKLALRKKIEQAIRQLLVDNEVEAYIQDKFFTVRADRYVVPIRLDGRGRVKGSIYDTSDSGQTLYIEPQSIAPQNEQLLELELQEKLEILRIFREISGQVAQDIDILTGNYRYLIDLDVMVAKATFAHSLNATDVRIADRPTLCLKAARHPLLQLKRKELPVANDIFLNSEQTSLIISGPNAGGKTVILKTVGLLHFMAKSGLLLPASEDSEVFLFDEIYVAMGDPQNLEASLSTFSGQLLSLKPIIDQAGTKSLVLLDELAVGTEPLTASAIAQAVLEDLADKQVHTLTTTHFDGLKALAVRDLRFRNGSMEFSKKSFKPTYNLVLDIPGQSYGLEVAEQLGFSPKILGRAKTLRGALGTELDELLRSMSQSRLDLDEARAEMQKERREMEAQKFHWLEERKALEQERAKVAKKMTQVYEEKFAQLKTESDEALARLKTLLRQEEQTQVDSGDAKASIRAERAKLQELQGVAREGLNELNRRFDSGESKPGVPCELSDLKVGSRVFVLSLGKEAVVSQIQEGRAPVEVQAGLLKLRPQVSELRLLDPPDTIKPTKPRSIPSTRGVVRGDNPADIPFQIVDPKTSLDLRGLDAERALQLLWDRIDKAVMQNDGQIAVIHGHGTAVLKSAIRTALAKESPYALDFRPGTPQEGGDGVTIIRIR